MNILIVDDQPRIRQSLQRLIRTLPGIADIVEASGGLDALRMADQIQPHLVVMDVRMPDLDGLEAARRLKGALPDIKIILLSMYPEYADEAASCADAFVSKADPPNYLLSEITRLLDLNDPAKTGSCSPPPGSINPLRKREG